MTKFVKVMQFLVKAVVRKQGIYMDPVCFKRDGESKFREEIYNIIYLHFFEKVCPKYFFLKRKKLMNLKLQDYAFIFSKSKKIDK